MLDRVSRAVAWQRVDQHCYNILKINIPSVETTVQRTQIEHLLKMKLRPVEMLGYIMLYIYKSHDWEQTALKTQI
jgi:hypothetical protein